MNREAEEACSYIIKQLASVCQSQPFSPHITLGSGSDLSEQEIAKAMEKLASETSPFEVFAKDVQCKENSYQKITLEIEKTADLTSLHQKLDNVLSGEYAKKEYPHISFLYSTLPCKKVTDAVLQAERKQPRRIIVEKMALVHCKGTPKDWRTLYIWNLKSAKSLI